MLVLVLVLMLIFVGVGVGVGVGVWCLRCRVAGDGVGQDALSAGGK